MFWFVIVIVAVSEETVRDNLGIGMWTRLGGRLRLARAHRQGNELLNERYPGRFRARLNVNM